jgi:hypothetical protein
VLEPFLALKPTFKVVLNGATEAEEVALIVGNWSLLRLMLQDALGDATLDLHTIQGELGVWILDHVARIVERRVAEQQIPDGLLLLLLRDLLGDRLQLLDHSLLSLVEGRWHLLQGLPGRPGHLIFFLLTTSSRRADSSSSQRELFPAATGVPRRVTDALR